ncbi:ATP-binding protein [Microcella alkalica]
MTAVLDRPPLARPREVLLSGVSTALADHLGWSLPRVRFAFVALAVLGGGGALLYAWLWALTPLRGERPGDAPVPVRADAPLAVRRRVPGAILLLVAAGVAGLVTIAAAVTRDRADPVDAAFTTLLLAGASVAWSLLLDRHDPGRGEREGVVVRSIAAGGLIVTALVVLAANPGATTVIVALIMIVGGTGVFVAPLVVGLWSTLIAERSARVREESRAEVAAHLQDSVLQTLALIQNRAEPGSEVARLARAQERELRDWLFAGTKPSDADFAAQLRQAALEIELQHPVRFDVVTTGDFSGHEFEPVLAAAREAMLNAARHAGGEVSVYVELRADALELWVRDRGPGFDPATIPADRLGVRESIIRRMARHGGSATVTRLASGTEVALRLPLGAAPAASSPAAPPEESA